MNEISRIAQVSAVVVPLSTVINVGLGIIVILVVFFVLKGAYSRHLRQTEDVDKEKSLLNAQSWLAKRQQALAKKAEKASK